MFIDKVKVSIEAGDGGNGAVSFRRERFIDRGGPNGGDGGNGADVYFVASRNQNTLANFRYQKLIKAEHGQTGGSDKKHGKSGARLNVPVPIGTVVAKLDGTQIADLITDGQEAIVAKGGRGGFGNAHFVSSVRQAPRVAEKGEKGDKFEATLELKMIADVGLIGLPNAGKSTLISVISGAKPEIASYPFTTLTPNLGVVDIDKKTSLLFADIPGLIEGASQGKGLGDEFLRHIERTKVLVHLIDIYDKNPSESYKIVRKELKTYSAEVAKKPELVVLTKCEGLDNTTLNESKKVLSKSLGRGVKIFAISAQSRLGLAEMLYEVKNIVQKYTLKETKKVEKKEALAEITHSPNPNDWTVKKIGKKYIVEGEKIESFAARTDFENQFGIERLQDILRRWGVYKELEKLGIQAGDKIYFGSNPNFLTY